VNGALRWIGVLVLIGACATVRPPPAPVRQTNLGLKISKVELANGLRVVLVHDPRAIEVQVTMRYQVGSVDDPPGQEGVAHLVEHLMFEQILGAQSLFSRLEDIATYFNATTTFDATTYVSRAHSSYLGELLSMESIRLNLRCTSITDPVFDRERAVVLNEIRQRDHTTELLGSVHDGLYPAGHPYRRPVGGTEASVGAITRDQACAFADAHYGPRNAVLVVSGNLTAEQLEKPLTRLFARLPNRVVAAPAGVPRVELKARRSEVLAPLDDDALIVAWPLPSDPRLRAKVRAIAVATTSLVDGKVKGRVALRELGDDRAPMIGVIVAPTTDETLQDVQRSVELGIDEVPDAFRASGSAQLGELAFTQIQQGAIYNLFANLEEGSDRDTRLATYVLAGLEPMAALGDEIQGLRTMTRDEAVEIARDNLGFARATVVVLKQSEGKKRGRDVELAAPIHDMGQRREPPDPADALRPLAASVTTSGFEGMTMRELPNGLDVVLLPLTSVPTTDVRLIFKSGTADEPAGLRGVALVAAHALTWDWRYLNDMLLFAAAGGTNQVDLSTDHTTFAARGLDMHLDLLLAGLRRWTRDGKYNRAALVVDSMRREAKNVDDEGAITDAWRTASFGTHHPYVQAGLVRHVSDALTADDVAKFRAAHYTPDNATLVIAGRFDAALANRWIDFLFADWTGVAEVRSSTRSSSQPASLAKDEPLAQVHVRISLPATSGSRAEQLVAAAMLSEIARDVRYQLGASYGLDAQLGESRLATRYVISGWVDAGRASEVIELLRARIETLRSDAEAAARAFVSARKRVVPQLLALTGSAAMLAARIQSDVELERAPMSDLRTATKVQALTIGGMTSSLAELDLAHAIILMRGPAADVDRAFGVLGRTPTYVRANPAAPESPSPARAEPQQPTENFSFLDLEPPLTMQPTSTRFTLALTAGYSTGSVIQHDVNGFTLGGELGYRMTDSTAVGLQLSIGTLTGTYDVGAAVPDLRPIEVLPLGLAGFLQATAHDRLWAAVFTGLRLDRVNDDAAEPVWHPTVALGLQGGIDAVKVRRHRLGAYARLEGGFASGAAYSAFTLGLTYRLGI
jgi:zinc protease